MAGEPTVLFKVPYPLAAFCGSTFCCLAFGSCGCGAFRSGCWREPIFVEVEGSGCLRRIGAGRRCAISRGIPLLLFMGSQFRSKSF